MNRLTLILLALMGSSCASYQSYSGYGVYGAGYYPYGSSTWNGTAWRPGMNTDYQRPVMPYYMPMRMNRFPASRR